MSNVDGRGEELLKELFTGCARLNLGRVVGLFAFIYKVCYFLFNGVVYLFVDCELRFQPSSLGLPTPVSDRRIRYGLRLYLKFENRTVTKFFMLCLFENGAFHHCQCCAV